MHQINIGARWTASVVEIFKVELINRLYFYFIYIYDDEDEVMKTVMKTKIEDDRHADSFDMDDVDISFEDSSLSESQWKIFKTCKCLLEVWNRWSVEDDIWDSINIKVKSADYVDLTGDLLFKYVLEIHHLNMII
ncbi:unnamed protein product [Rhizophagus irregularis]|nr:unnamed protein product [Rhizophagus irregularis]